MTTWQPQAKAPRPVLTFVGVGAVVVGLMVSAVFVVQLMRVLPGAPVPVDGRPVRLDGVGLTVFSTDRNAGQSCTAKGAEGNEIALKAPSRHEQWDDAGDRYYVVAHSVQKVPAQTVEVVCANTEARYYVGRRHTADVFLTPALKAVTAFFVPAAIGAGLIIVDQLRRRRRTHP